MISSDEIATYLKYLQNSSGLTQQEWEEASGVPNYTISRILCGKTYSPPFSAVAALVMTAGGSLDDLAGISAPDQRPAKHSQELVEQKERSITYLKNQVAKQEADVANLRKHSARKTVAIGAMLFLLGALLMWDLMDPHYGFFYRVFCGWHDAKSMLFGLKG